MIRSSVRGVLGEHLYGPFPLHGHHHKDWSCRSCYDSRNEAFAASAIFGSNGPDIRLSIQNIPCPLPAFLPKPDIDDRQGEGGGLHNATAGVTNKHGNLAQKTS